MILDRLKIYGTDLTDEKAIFASILLGDPVLLIGPHGSAKTELGKAIAVALQEYSKLNNTIDEYTASKIQDSGILPKEWFKFATYDCSKMQFEEIIGFPNPKTFEKGYVTYVESPVTVWDKQMVILDEFNRQSPRQQNSLFELIRSRTIYGQPTNTKIIFACMNPYGMEGTEILDEALVDRMSIFIYTKSFEKLDDEVKENIIQKMGPNDSPGLTHWSDYTPQEKTNHLEVNEPLASIGEEITELLSNAAKIFFSLKEESGDSYALFVNRFLGLTLKEKDFGIHISSRRAAMIQRMLLAYRSVEIAMSQKYGTQVDSLDISFINTITRCLPIGISESTGEYSQDVQFKVTNIIETMSQFFTNDGYTELRTAMDVLLEIMTSDNLIKKVKLLLQYGDTTSELSCKVWNEISKTLESDNFKYSEKNMQNIILSIVIGNLYHFDKSLVPDNIGEQISKTIPSKQSLANKVTETINFMSSQISMYQEIKNDIETYADPLEKLYATMLWKIALKDNSISKDQVSGYARHVLNNVSELNLLIAELRKHLKNNKTEETTTDIEKVFNG